MATQSWPELIKQWACRELDHERAIGQLLLWGRQTHDELQQSRRQQEQLADAVDRLTVRLAALEKQRRV